MAYEFFVLMQKRADGKVYPDLHKTDERIYLFETEVDAALTALGDMGENFHKVKMVGVLVDDWYRDELIRSAPDLCETLDAATFAGNTGGSE